MLSRISGDIQRDIIQMGEQTPTAMWPDDLTPRTLNQVYRQIVDTAKGSVKVGRQLVAVHGHLGPIRDRAPSALYFYEVYLTRIIHQSQKPTEEGALGSRMILKTTVSQERHHPKTRA